MDLIDREQLMNYIRSRKINIGKLAHDVIMKQPSIQPQEPKTGHWIKSKDGYMRCDQCGSRGSAIKARFCHHCGAKMERSGEE